jgi:hypothetical protein
MLVVPILLVVYSAPPVIPDPSWPETFGADFDETTWHNDGVQV